MTVIEYDQDRVIEIEEGVLAWVDEDTGLMWEIKSIKNIQKMYVWHKRYIEELPILDGNGEKLPYEKDVKDAASYVERLNSTQYAGYSDWRLPTPKELESLIDLNGEFRLIKKPLQHNTCAAYWSSTPNLMINVYKVPGASPIDTAAIPAVKIVDFTNATTGGYAPKNSLWVRCVRDNATSSKKPKHMTEKRTFKSYEEAIKWARINPGKVITRSPNDEGYIEK